MLVVCAPDAFKHSMSSRQAADAMARGVRQAGHDAVVCPVADGGEGTADVLHAALGGIMHVSETVDPVHRLMSGSWLELPDGTALIETATASGLPLLSAADRDPLRATSTGTGMLIAAAIEAGVDRVLIGVGGTATVDGGCGMLQALGVEWLDESGGVLEAPIPPAEFASIASMRTTRPLPEMVGLVDTNTTLDAAATMFAPQKGAALRQVQPLTGALDHLAQIMDPTGTARTPPGSGAGGGIGFAIAACGGRLRPGAEMVLEAINFNRHLAPADLVITGEGCLDAQTATGKAPHVVALAAAHAGVPCIAVAGMLGDGIDECLATGAWQSVAALLDQVPLEQAMGDPEATLAAVTCQLLSDEIT